jgi:hypothetical protein
VILTTSPGRIEMSAESGGGHQKPQIAQTVCWPAEDYQRDLASGEVLLVGNILVDGNEDIEADSLRSLQETAVLQSSQSREASGLAVVAGKQKSQALVNALIDQEAHQPRASSNCLASSKASNARARETVGNPLRKSSSVSPPPK